MLLITVSQISKTGTDVPLVTKISSVVDEDVGDDVGLILDPGGPPPQQQISCPQASEAEISIPAHLVSRAVSAREKFY